MSHLLELCPQSSETCSTDTKVADESRIVLELQRLVNLIVLIKQEELSQYWTNLTTLGCDLCRHDILDLLLNIS